MPAKLIRMQHSERPPVRRPVVLAIAGDSAAGKSTLTRGLVDALGADRCTAISVDDYHRYDRAERAGLPFTALHPECNHIEIMEQHLQLLALGRPVLKPVYDHATGSLTRPMLVEPGEFLIVEGLLPLSTRLARACFDVTVFLDPEDRLRHAWKLRRDTTQRGYTVPQVKAELRRRESDAEEFVRPQRRLADIVVSHAPVEPGTDCPLSLDLLLRPTVRQPALAGAVNEHGGLLRLAIVRDEGTPTDLLHVNGLAPSTATREVEQAIWEGLGQPGGPPDSLGTIPGADRSGALAITQLILLHHLIRGSDLARAGG